SMAARAEETAHPLLERREGERILLWLVTADKGLGGGFNANIIRTAVRFLQDKRPDAIELELLGRKGRDFFRRRHYKVRSEQVGLFQALRSATAEKIAHGLIKAFTEREADQVYLVYNEFKSVIQQRVIVKSLLPIERRAIEPSEPGFDYLYEPGPAKIYA